MTLRVSLGGAHHPVGRPEAQGRLDVRVTLSLGSSVIVGTVDAEGIATRARAVGRIRVALPRLHYELAFDADDGRPLLLTASQALGRLSPRSLTELTGHLATRGDGQVVALVRLRLDVRRALGL